MNNIIAIQGIKGSYHYQVAIDYFGTKINFIECLSFDHLVKSVSEDDKVIGVMAIENSIAGSIIPNYALIDQNNLKIVGEYNLKINHCFMALSGQIHKDIKEVHSHPMALLQCKKYFDKYPHIRLVEADDTAEVARKIYEEKIPNIAAIASSTSADLFKLKVLDYSIQTIKNNITRFVIVQKNESSLLNKKINKATLKFILNDERGSLAEILNVMLDLQINLTKIQSLPVIETPGKYSFFVDISFENFEYYIKACSILNLIALEFKVLGGYIKNNQ